MSNSDNPMVDHKWVKMTVKNSVKGAKDRMGSGWSLLSSELRQAMVAQVALGILGNLDTDTVSGDLALRIIAVASEVSALDL